MLEKKSILSLGIITGMTVLGSLTMNGFATAKTQITNESYSLRNVSDTTSPTERGIVRPGGGRGTAEGIVRPGGGRGTHGTIHKKKHKKRHKKRAATRGALDEGIVRPGGGRGTTEGIVRPGGGRGENAPIKKPTQTQK